MKIDLTKNEQQFLNRKNISISSYMDYIEDEVFNLLDQIEDAEIYYAQDPDTNKTSMELAKMYRDIYDKVQNMIK